MKHKMLFINAIFCALLVFGIRINAEELTNKIETIAVQKTKIVKLDESFSLQKFGDKEYDKLELEDDLILINDRCAISINDINSIFGNRIFKDDENNIVVMKVQGEYLVVPLGRAALIFKNHIYKNPYICDKYNGKIYMPIDLIVMIDGYEIEKGEELAKIKKIEDRGIKDLDIIDDITDETLLTYIGYYIPELRGEIGQIEGIDELVPDEYKDEIDNYDDIVAPTGGLPFIETMDEMAQYVISKMKNYETEINFKCPLHFKAKDLVKMINYIKIDPRVYEKYKAATYGVNSGYASIEVWYRYNKAQEQRIENFVDEWTKNNINKNMSDFEKVDKIRKYIIDKALYTKNSGSEFDQYTSGAIVFGKGGVCQSYATLFSRMATRAGLENIYITGQSIPNIKVEKEYHAWNKVKVDNNWYNIDITWDDPPKGWKYGPIRTFYLKSDKTFSRTHEPDKIYSAPKALKDYKFK